MIIERECIENAEEERRSMLTIETANVITLSDYSDYDTDLHNNGGHYAYHTKYYRIGDTSEFEVLHYASADMEYCPVCGRFYNSHCSCGYPEYENYEVVQQEDIIKRIEEDKELCVEMW